MPRELEPPSLYGDQPIFTSAGSAAGLYFYVRFGSWSSENADAVLEGRFSISNSRKHTATSLRHSRAGRDIENLEAFSKARFHTA
jgi:hypothetical protein